MSLKKRRALILNNLLIYTEIHPAHTVYVLITGMDYNICESASMHINHGEVGEEGNITSPLYPAPVQWEGLVGPGNLKPPCRMYLTVCSECRIQLRFVELELPRCRTPLPVHGAGCISQ